DAALAQAVAGMRDGGGRLLAVYGDAHHFGAGARESCDLRDRAIDIGGVGVGHRLHHDRGAAADRDVADLDLRGPVPGAGAGDVDFREFFGLVHGATEYQVLVTITKGTGAGIRQGVAGYPEWSVSIVNSTAYRAGHGP